MQLCAEATAGERAGKADIGAKHSRVDRENAHHVRGHPKFLLHAIEQGFGLGLGGCGIDRGQNGHLRLLSAFGYAANLAIS
jgi:hypothetical protein